MTFKSSHSNTQVKEELVTRETAMIPGNIPVFGANGKMKDSGQRQMWSLDLFQIRMALAGIFNSKYLSTTSASRSANIATLAAYTTHTFKVGENITVELPDITYNGTFPITAVGSTTISYANVGADSPSVANDGGITLVSPRIASLAHQGDSVGVSFISLEFTLKMWYTFGFRGLLISRTLGTPLGTFVNVGGTIANNVFNLNPGGYADILTTGNQLEVKVSATDKNGNTYKVNQAKVVYVKYPSGGTFKCQQKARGKINWEDIVGFTAINTIDATEQLASITVPFTLGAEFRIVANTDTIKITHVLMEDTNVAGLIQSNFARGGTKIIDLNTITQTSLNVLMGVIKPDLITCTYKDAIGTIAADLETQQILYNNACTTDWLFITPYPGVSLGDIQYDIWINHAKKYNKAWFDTRYIIDTYANALATGMLRDTTHMNNAGGQNGENILWDKVGLDKGYQAPVPNAVNNEKVETKQLLILGEDYTVRQRNQKTLSFNLNGGLKLLSGTTAQIINHAAVASVGTGSFSMVIFMKVPPVPVANLVMALRPTPSGGSANDSIELAHTIGSIVVNTRMAGVNYSWSYLKAGVDLFANHAGKVVMLALRRDASAGSMVDDPFTVSINKTHYKTLSAFPIDGKHSINSSYFVVGSSSTELTADLITYKSGFYSSHLTDAELDLMSDTGELISGATMAFNTIRGASRACKTNIPGNPGKINTGTFEWIERGPAAPYLHSGTWSDEPNSINVGTGGSAGVDVYTLPANPEFGDTYKVIGRRNGLWELRLPSDTQVVMGAGLTVGSNATAVGPTVGAVGMIKATGRYDNADFFCVNDARGLTGTGSIKIWVPTSIVAPGGLIWT